MVKGLFPQVDKFDIDKMYELYKKKVEEEQKQIRVISFIIGPVKRGMFNSIAMCTTSRKRFENWKNRFEREENVEFASKDFDKKFFGCMKITSYD